MEYTFTDNTFNEEVLNSTEPVMIDFYADWCMPCRMMSRSVSSLASRYEGKAKVGRVNVDREPALARKFNVMSIPNFVFIKDGKVVDQTVGAMPESVLASKLDALIKS